MSLTVQQIITLACQKANCTGTGFLVTAGEELNLILQELAQSYSFFSAQGFLTGTFGSGIGGVVNSANVVVGSGPYQLPADFLSMDYGDFFWQNGGINYFPTPVDKNEFDNLVQQPGFSTYPTGFFVDMSTSPAGLYVWPAPSGAFPFFGRYSRQMPDIANPQISNVIPWFPSQKYLLQRLAGEMMGYTGDTRQAEWLGNANGDPPWSATGILKAFKAKEGNMDNRAARVQLDPRHFGPRWNRLPGTKSVPW